MMPEIIKKWIAGKNVKGEYVALELQGIVLNGRFIVNDADYTADAARVLDYRRNLPVNHLVGSREAAIKNECDRMLRDIEVHKAGIERLEKRFWGFKKLLA